MNLGSKVIVLECGELFMLCEDQDVVVYVIIDLENKGIVLYINVEMIELLFDNYYIIVYINVGNFEVDVVFLVIGCKLNMDLVLENIDIELGDRGEIKVNVYF